MNITSHQILLIIVIFLLADYTFERFIGYLNIKNQKPEIPEDLKEIYNKEDYEKSIAYNKTRYNFSIITGLFSLFVTLIVLYTGLLGSVNDWFFETYSSPITASLLFIGSMYIVSDIINLPFDLYSQFGIEKKFGFSKMTIKTYITDKIKGYFLAAIIGGGLFYALLKIVDVWGSEFWLYFWVIATGFIIFFNMFYTSLIVPLFNKLVPLEDGSLRKKIEEYAKSVKFPLTNVYVINGSKRSTKSNAYFSGLGPNKKIVLFDTLIEKHTDDELVAVLAHEVGHFKKKHIVQGLFISIFQIGIILFILSRFIDSTILSQSLGSNMTSVPLNLIAFSFLFSPISKIISIVMNIFSRKNEYEADAYAVNTSDGNALMTALKKLSTDNLANPSPHPLFVYVHYSHPPLLHRLQAMSRLTKKQ